MTTNSYEIADIAEKFFGTPYTFGGNDIETGIDCSALVSEVLRSVGRLDRKDYSAQMLWDKFSLYDWEEEGARVAYKLDESQHTTKSLIFLESLKRNDIIFYGGDCENITHIAIYLGELMIIEAGGEGRVETTKGYVRYRPLNHRKDLIGVVRFR